MLKLRIASPSEERLRIGGIGLFKDPISSLTHFAGFLASLIGLVMLVTLSMGSTAKLTSMAIYGASLALLFLASSAYHFFDLGAHGNAWLRRLDHAAISLGIAGTYVPTMIHYLDGTWRVAMLVVVATLALCGIAFRILWVDCPKWLGVGVYVTFGWIVLIPAYIIFPKMSVWELSWLGAGGIFYSVGALVYASKSPNPWPGIFGFHEIWHLFVLGGAGAHFVFIASMLDMVTTPF